MGLHTLIVMSPLYAISHRIVREPDSAPLQEQLAVFLRERIVSGALKPGLRLPASRQAAAELGLSRNTVVWVYERLAAEGLLEARQGQGTFVASPPARPSGISEEDDKHPNVSRRAQEAVADRRDDDIQRQFWPLTPCIPAMDRFPSVVWGRLAQRWWRQIKRHDLGYDNPGGWLPLRQALAAYLGATRGVVCDAQQIVVTAGTQEAVALAAFALADAGARAWVEAPGYLAIRRALRLAGIEAVPVAVDDGGLSVQAGYAAAPDARFAVVTPAHQYPLGMTMCDARRRALLAWATDCNAYIVEDDFDGEFRYDHAPTPALQGQDRNGRVLYVGTLSKLLAPSIRLGYLVAPPALVPALLAVRDAMSRHLPLPQQAVAAQFIQGGYLGEHIRNVTPLYRERRAALIRALAELSGGEATIHGADAGLHLVAHLAQAEAIAHAAQELRVGIRPLSHYSHAAPAPPGLVIGFGNTPTARIGTVLRQVFAAAGLRRATPA